MNSNISTKLSEEERDVEKDFGGKNTILLPNAKCFLQKQKKNPSFIRYSYILRERMIIRKIRYKNWQKLSFPSVSPSFPVSLAASPVWGGQDSKDSAIK